MNRNKQRQMLRMKREIGFHDISETLADVPVAAAAEPGRVVSYEVRVKYSEEGGAHYLITSRVGVPGNPELLLEWRRSQFTRAAWNRKLEKLGMHPVDHWLMTYNEATGEAEFIRRIRGWE